MSLWVVDTSPLIYLAQVDRLDLLRRGADEILVPPTVLQEVRVKRGGSSKIEAAHRTWLRLEAPLDQNVVKVLQLELDTGESEAIALAIERSANRIVMDDLAGRRCARRLGLSLIGTLGLLLAARLRGELESMKSEIERLRATGFYAGEALVEKILRAAGE